MLANAVEKVARAARVTLLTVGALVVTGVVGVALAGTGVGAVFNLGRTNTVNQPSRLVGATDGPNLAIDNNGTGVALDLRVGPSSSAPGDKTTAPMKVDSQKKVRNLNADEVDGRGPGPRGYAIVDISPVGLTRSRAVNGVVYDGDAGDQQFCFDLTFVPKVAVGSSFLNNNAVIATQTPAMASLGDCPEGYRDAAVRVYGANDPSSTPRNDVNFSVMFE